MGVLGLFCGLLPDGQPRGAARRRLVEPLPCAARRRPARSAPAIIGVAAFSKPTNAALAVPIVAAALLRRDWRIDAGAALAFAALVRRAVGLNLATSGEVNYQGGERATYYEAKGFLFMTAAAPISSPLTQTAPTKGGGAGRPDPRCRQRAPEIILPRNSLVEVFPRTSSTSSSAAANRCRHLFPACSERVAVP